MLLIIFRNFFLQLFSQIFFPFIVLPISGRLAMPDSNILLITFREVVSLYLLAFSFFVISFLVSGWLAMPDSNSLFIIFHELLLPLFTHSFPSF